MASKEIDRPVTVRAHVRSAPTRSTSEVTRVTERATLTETADARSVQYERITEFRGKK